MKQYLKKRLLNSIYGMGRIVLSVIKSFDVFLISLMSRSGFLASLYYLIFSRRFDREHLAVLNGRLDYHRAVNSAESSGILLRRNIHRLEKGLIMKPARKVFADSYICETVDSYLKYTFSGDASKSELKWCENVLVKYFSVVDVTENISNAKIAFEKRRAKEVEHSFVPYSYEELPSRVVNYDDLLVVFKRRRSVRWYEERKVEIKLIERAIDAAAMAPSACNRQPFKFLITTDPSVARDVSAFAMGTDGFSDGIPCVVALVGELSAYPSERDRHVIYIDGGLVAMQFMLALETLGLASCPINWPDIERREVLMSEKLGLPKSSRVIMLISVGYPDNLGKIPYSQKKNHSNLMREI